MPLPKRPVGDELAEELRRLDPDQIYGEALAAMAGLSGLDEIPVPGDGSVEAYVAALASPTPDRSLTVAQALRVAGVDGERRGQILLADGVVEQAHPRLA